MIDQRQEIGQLIGDAMRSAEGVDWAKEDERISAAQVDLDEAMTLYVEGAATKTIVRAAYHKWRDLHKTGGLLP